MTLITKERTSYIDVLRGLGIFLVVYGHITRIWYPDRVYIWSFHMPLFFFISGMLFQIHKYPSFIDYIKRKVKSLLIPYCVLYFISLNYWYFIEGIIMHRGFEHSSYFEQLLLMFVGNMTSAGGALWFLPCLFTVEILYYTIYQQTRTSFVRIIICFALATIGVFLHKSGIKGLPWGLNSVLLVMPFYSIASVFGEDINRLFNKYKCLFCIIAIILGVSLQYLLFPYSDLDLSMYHLRNGLTYIPMALAGIIICYTIARIIHSNHILEWIGNNSICIFAFHGFVYHAIIYAIAQISGIEMNELRTSYLWCISITIMSIICLFPVSVVYKRSIEKLWK